MQDLKELPENQSEALKHLLTATYASVAAVQGPRQGRNSLHSVVVSSNNESKTGEAILSRVREAVDAKEGWVKVERVRQGQRLQNNYGLRDKGRQGQSQRPTEQEHGRPHRLTYTLTTEDSSGRPDAAGSVHALPRLRTRQALLQGTVGRL